MTRVGGVGVGFLVLNRSADVIINNANLMCDVEEGELIVGDSVCKLKRS